jgi:hypothetical protein
MNDQYKKRQAQEHALKDGLVAQVWALSDEDVVAQAHELGDGIETAQARILSMREKAERASVSESSTVVPLSSVRTPASVESVLSRRRTVRPMRLVASVEPPAGTSDSKDSDRDPDQS